MTDYVHVSRVNTTTMDDGLEVEVVIHRRAFYLGDGEPRAADVPEDIRAALAEWLGTSAPPRTITGPDAWVTCLKCGHRAGQHNVPGVNSRGCGEGFPDVMCRCQVPAAVIARGGTA